MRVPVAFAVALAFLAASVGYAVGSRDTAPGRGSVDVGFLYDMIGHHEQAITLSKLELVKGSEGRVKSFAEEILYYQGYEIGLMTQQLRSWGHRRDEPPERAMAWMGHGVPREDMPGMASQAELDALYQAQGRDVDARFLALMIDHHAGGVHMAEEALRRATSSFVRDFADRTVRQQRTEIREMELARDRLGLPAAPPG
ncbi:MAG TPA: DUF305 domain-containing protein [Acidimicrobiales bacterium]|nr:DUF305 domain-containing protein [Acidimicrobiales bacterium]